MASPFPRNPTPGKRVGVYAFDGDTFEFVLLGLDGESYGVLATASGSIPDEEDLVLAMARSAATGFRRRTGLDIGSDEDAWARLVQACAAARPRLAEEPSVEVRVPAVAETPRGPVDLLAVVTRAFCDAFWAPVVRQSLDLSEEALYGACISARDLDEIIVAAADGARLDAARESVRLRFGREPRALSPRGIPHDEPADEPLPDMAGMGAPSHRYAATAADLARERATRLAIPR